jgi:endonuclease-3 related protein
MRSAITARIPRLPQDPLKRRLLRLYDALLSRFGPQRWWPGQTDFEVAVGAILTQHTAWVNVERAIAALKARNLLAPERLRDLPEQRLARLIRSSGTFNMKARRLRAFVQFLWDRYGGVVSRMAPVPLEALRRELRSVRGIGPETADAILLYAVGRPVFVVDAYTRRVLARHSLVPPGISYEPFRAFLERHLPRDPALFNEYHALLLAVGKTYCRSRPRCEECPLRFDLRGRPPRRI